MAKEVPAEIFSKKMAALTRGYSKRAYVTFLAGCGDYVKGVVGLAKGLRKVKSLYPLVVAVLPDVPEDHRLQLRNQGCIVRQIDPINPPENQVHFAMAYYVLNYSKLRIWEFEYSKLVYLDADIQVFDNIDNLFDIKDGYFYAVMDCFCEKTWSHTPQYKIGYCQQCPDKVTWPVEMEKDRPALYFNAGMFVFEPSKLTFDSMMGTLMSTTPTPFAEQDFLNMYFQKMFKPIPLVYNLVLAMLWRHPENVDIERVKVAHYCAAGSKPWRFSGKEENMEREDVTTLVKKWWEIYNDESLDLRLNKRSAEPEAEAEAEVEAESRCEVQQISGNALRGERPKRAPALPAPPAA